MASIRRFEDIQAWQKARELVRAVFKETARGPLANDLVLKNQMCRAAVSCMANIAEGFAGKSEKDFAHFLDIAKGSASEVQSLLYAELDIGYISSSEFERLYKLANEAASLIGGFTSYLRKIPAKGKGSSEARQGPRTPDSEPRDH